MVLIPFDGWSSGNGGGRIAMAVSMWRHAVHGRFPRIPGRSRFGAGRGRVRHGRSPGERGQPGERRANDITGCARRLGSITDGDANAYPDAQAERDADPAQPAAAQVRQP